MQPSDGQAGAGFELMARLSASVDGLAGELKSDRDRRDRLSQLIQPFSIPSIAVPYGGATPGNGVGNTDVPNMLGPRSGQVWDVHQISTTGWATGTMSVFLDAVNGTLVAQFSAAPAVLNFGKGQLLITAGSRLIIVGAAATGAVAAAAVALRGVQMDARMLGDYLL